jgi:DinB superfamily
MSGADVIEELRALRRETVSRLAGMSESALIEPRPWRGGTADLRHVLGWLAEGDENAFGRICQTLALLGRPPTVAQLAMVEAGRFRGRLLGSFIGLSETQFDAPPGPGEWSVRRVLGHVIATDLRYAIAVRYAVERARTGGTGPLRPPDAALPSRIGEAFANGSMNEAIDELSRTGDGLSTELGAIPDSLLDAPTNWVAWNLDVRFRLHRFAAHLREHTIQVAKVLHAFGFAQTEAQLFLGEAMAARGALEALVLSTPDHLLAAAPADGGPSVLRTIEQVISDERSLLASA